MVISLVQFVYICVFFCLIVGAGIFCVFRICKNGISLNREKQNKEKQNKGRPHYALGILLVLTFAIGIIYVGNYYKASKWKNVPMTEEDKVRIATSELLLPELSKYMNRQYVKSFRDVSYLYDTVWFDNADQIYDLMNYSDENQRIKAKQALLNHKVETLEFDTLEGGKMEVYQISEQELPIQNEQLRGENCQYRYYVILDSYYNNQAKLLCVKNEY